MLTIIPDIHADLARLDRAIALAGTDKIAFLGDFIDSGSWNSGPAADGAVLRRVRSLLETGRAVAVMGNHELNAILYHRRHSDGTPMRRHSPKNRDQHQSFLTEFGVMTEAALEWTEWFLTHLPLWREESGVRLVHACWSDRDQEIIRQRRPDGYLKPEDLPEIACEDSEFGRAVKRTVSGQEALLPAGFQFHDYKGVARREVRLRWWARHANWRAAALSVPDVTELPDADLPKDFALELYPTDAAPVFVGHYKMHAPVAFDSAKVLCLDYPKAPCLYRWQGEADLRQEHLIFA